MAERFHPNLFGERCASSRTQNSSRDSPSILADAGSQSGANAECRTGGEWTWGERSHRGPLSRHYGRSSAGSAVATLVVKCKETPGANTESLRARQWSCPCFAGHPRARGTSGAPIVGASWAGMVIENVLGGATH